MANKLFFSAVMLLSFSTLGVIDARADNFACRLYYGLGKVLFPKYDANKIIANYNLKGSAFLIEYVYGRELVAQSLESQPLDAARLDQMVDEKLAELESKIQTGQSDLSFKDYKKEIEQLLDMRDSIPANVVAPSNVDPSAIEAMDISKQELTATSKVAVLQTILENAYGHMITPPGDLHSYFIDVIKKAKVKDGFMDSKEARRILQLLVKRVTPMELPETQPGALMTTNMRTRFERMITKSFKPAARRVIERSVLSDPFFKSYFESVLNIDYVAPKNGVAKRTARNLFAISFATGADIMLVKMGMPPLVLPGMALQTNVSKQVKNTAQTQGFEAATNALISEINFFRTPQFILRPIRMLRTRALLIFAATYLGQHPQLITMPYDMFKVYQTTHSAAPGTTEIGDPTTTGIYDDGGTVESTTTTANGESYDPSTSIQNAVDDFTIRTDIASDNEIAAMRVLYEKVESAARNGKADSLNALQGNRLAIIKKYRLVNWAISEKILGATPSDSEIQKLMNSSDQNVVAKRTEINAKADQGGYDDLYISAQKLTALYNDFASHNKK